VAQELGLYEDFLSTPWEGGRGVELGLGRSICKGPKLGVEEEDGTYFSFPAVGTGV